VYTSLIQDAKVEILVEVGQAERRRQKSPMGIQEQAFRLYYSSMTDAKLLETAAHKSSLIGLAQNVLAEELDRRNLAPPVERSEPARAAAGFGALATLVHKLRLALKH
jgi:hypothetical protein